MIRNKYRRTAIKAVAFTCLNKFPCHSLPVDIKNIVASFSNIRLVPYSMQMQRRNLTLKEMIEFAESRDSCVDFYNKDGGKYIIYYNDVDFALLRSGRYRWNIAHELGHILLEHHKRSDKLRLFREGLPEQEYILLEEEADLFASYLLVPHPVLKALNIASALDISRYCGISQKASLIRAKDYLKWFSSTKFYSSAEKRILVLFQDFVDDELAKYCSRCKYKTINNQAIRCPICSAKLSKYKGEDTLIYPSIEIGKDGRVKKCLCCDNQEISSDAEFCKICGSPVINRCTNLHPFDSSCGSMAEGNARYCIMCGSSTTFLDKGLLKPWHKEKEELLKEKSATQQGLLEMEELEVTPF